MKSAKYKITLVEIPSAQNDRDSMLCVLLSQDLYTNEARLNRTVQTARCLKSEVTK